MWLGSDKAVHELSSKLRINGSLASKLWMGFAPSQKLLARGLVPTTFQHTSNILQNRKYEWSFSQQETVRNQTLEAVLCPSVSIALCSRSLLFGLECKNICLIPWQWCTKPRSKPFGCRETGYTDCLHLQEQHIHFTCYPLNELILNPAGLQFISCISQISIMDIARSPWSIRS